MRPWSTSFLARTLRVLTMEPRGIGNNMAGTSSTLPMTPSDIAWPFRRALLNHGVDLMGMGALVSCVHSEADIDSTIERFGAALSDLRRDEIF